MGLRDLLRPKPEDADEIPEKFIKGQAGNTLPLSLMTDIRASNRRERIVRIAQYYIWDSLNNEYSVTKKRDRAMTKVENEYDDINRSKLLNAVYALYEDRAEGEHALEEFEADLEATAAAYEQAGNTR